MISDKERREVAARLRESSGFISGLRGGATPQNAFDVFERILECIDYEQGNVFDTLADLIDRPTCHDVGGGYTFKCSECGCMICIFLIGEPTMTVHDEPLYEPYFCPNCGAEVVE